MSEHNGPYALWLPKNSIEALIGIELITGVIIGAFVGLPEGILTVLTGLASFVLGHYFGKRAGETKPES